jgi:Putative peptidoglycan binding domain
MIEFRDTAMKRWSLRPLSVLVALSVAANGIVPSALAYPSAAGAKASGNALAGSNGLPAMELAENTTPPAGSTPAPAADKSVQENLFWESAQKSNSPADYKAYLDAFPNGLYAPLAKNRIAAFSAPPAAAPAAAAAPVVQPAALVAAPAISPEALKAEIGTFETEQGLNLGPPMRMEIQQRLSAIGLYTGPIDGDLGPGARSAIAEWQKRHDTAPTGQLGPLQLAELRAESEGPYEQMMASRPPIVAPVYAPVRVYHAYHAVEHSSATPAVLGLLGGLAVGILGAKFGGKGGGKGGGKKHK